MIQQILNTDEKKRIARSVLEALPEWFGIAEAREEYIAESAGQLFFADYEEADGSDCEAGFLCLKKTGEATMELAVMGVRKEYHRQGIGRKLFEAAKASAAEEGTSFLQVKTVQMGRYQEYDETNLFYQSLGFQEFEVFPTLWDEWNPCQIYVMYVKK